MVGDDKGPQAPDEPDEPQIEYEYPDAVRHANALSAKGQTFANEVAVLCGCEDRSS